MSTASAECGFGTTMQSCSVKVSLLRHECWHVDAFLLLQVNPLPKDLQDRRVEITGPVDRKMVINALNSGASVFMADFEDSNAPTW